MTLLIQIVVAIAIYLFIRRYKPREPGRICADCGTQSDARSITKGSIWIEIVLWCCLIVPRIIYSLWRVNSRHQGCARCGSTRPIALDTPAGKQLAARFANPQGTIP